MAGRAEAPRGAHPKLVTVSEATGAGARSTCVISTEVPQFVEVLSKPRTSSFTRFAMRPSTRQTNALVTMMMMMMMTILLSVSLHGLSSVPLVKSYSRWYAAHAS